MMMLHSHLLRCWSFGRSSRCLQFLYVPVVTPVRNMGAGSVVVIVVVVVVVVDDTVPLTLPGASCCASGDASQEHGPWICCC